MIIQTELNKNRELRNVFNRDQNTKTKLLTMNLILSQSAYPAAEETSNFVFLLHLNDSMSLFHSLWSIDAVIESR